MLHKMNWFVFLLLTIMIISMLPNQIHAISFDCNEGGQEVTLHAVSDIEQVKDTNINEKEILNKKKQVKMNNYTLSETKSNNVEKAGVNARTMIVIVLLVGIAIILIYSFGFKKKK